DSRAPERRRTDAKGRHSDDLAQRIHRTADLALRSPLLQPLPADRWSLRDRSCYGPGDAGFEGFGRPHPDARSMTPRALAIREALQRRTVVSDAELDEVFPDELRERSQQHWTPVEV